MGNTERTTDYFISTLYTKTVYSKQQQTILVTALANTFIQINDRKATDYYMRREENKSIQK